MGTVLGSPLCPWMGQQHHHHVCPVLRSSPSLTPHTHPPTHTPTTSPTPCCPQGNHIYTSGATGTNAAVIKGALRADCPDRLTVILPQSRSKQPAESRELLEQVGGGRLQGHSCVERGRGGGLEQQRYCTCASEAAEGVLFSEGGGVRW